MLEQNNNFENITSLVESSTPPVFDPVKDLEKLRLMSKDERKEQFPAYLKEFRAYSKKIASVEVAVISAVERNLSVDKAILERLISTRCEELGIKEKTEITDVFNRFYERHAAVKQVYDRYEGDSKSIFKHLFKHDPIGNVEIIMGPSVLYTKCYDPTDYAFIYSGKFVSEYSTVSPQDVTNSKISGGVSVPGANNPALRGAIIAENSSVVIPASSSQIYEHELSHALKRLIIGAHITKSFLDKIRNAETYEMQIYHIDKSLENLRNNNDARIADEIIAYLVSGTDSDATYNKLTTSKKKGGLYDYYEEDKEQYDMSLNFLKQSIMVNSSIPTNKEDAKKILDGEIEKVFYTEFYKLIKSGIKSFRYLQSLGFTPKETRSLLLRTPLSRWERVSSRLHKKDLSFMKLDDFEDSFYNPNYRGHHIKIRGVPENERQERE